MTKSTLAVAINVYAESVQQVDECFIRIARNLPEAKVSVFLNGEDRSDVRRLADQLGFKVRYGMNLGTNRTWHLWWQRMLEFFCNTGCDVCFKFDPDTMVDRPPVAIPNASYFGDLHYSVYGFPFVQGGVTGLSIRAIKTIMNDQLLEPVGKKLWFTIRLSPNASFADDQLLALVLKHIDIVPVAWPECKSSWKLPVPNDPVTYAIVHPRYY